MSPDVKEYRRIVEDFLGVVALDELVALYIGVKTGDVTDYKKLPVGYLITLAQLDKRIAQIYADRVIYKALDNEANGK